MEGSSSGRDSVDRESSDDERTSLNKDFVILATEDDESFPLDFRGNKLHSFFTQAPLNFRDGDFSAVSFIDEKDPIYNLNSKQRAKLREWQSNYKVVFFGFTFQLFNFRL